MSERRVSGQVDLEKELKCSICTEILFQPLTLLDCLHTFCGSCVKEWFSFQASSAKSIHPYTCPSCRASVRGTTPNFFTVTTLLDMFLKANPSKDRTEEDKAEQRKKYKSGENVLPKLRLRRAPGEEEDQRVMEGVVALSLREAGISGNTLQEPGDSRRRRDGSSRGSRSRDSSRSAGRSRNEVSSQPSSRRGGHRSSREPSREPSTSPRGPVHQSSLRSLISTSDMDPQEMQEDILRQIQEDGLLDGIDLENMDTAQEEQLSEMIAHAYQQRRERTLQDRRRRDRSTTSTPSQAARPSSRDGSNARRADRPTAISSISTGAPPISNPHLIESANQGQPRQRRSGSGSSTRSASHVEAAIGASTTSRSMTDVFSSTGATSSGAERQRRMSHERSATDPDRVRASRRAHAQSTGSAPGSPGRVNTAIAPRTSSGQRSDSDSRPPRSPRTNATFPVDRHTRPTNNSSPALTTGPTTLEPQSSAGLAISNTQTSDHRPTSSSSTNRHPALFTEPSISCNRCNRTHIEHERHYTCPKCEGGNFNLCLQCYREGKGCLHWYGFGRAAWQRYKRQEPPVGYPPSFEKPHVLSGHCFLRPRHSAVPSPRPEQPNRVVSEEDPAKRLENGVFCDICSAFANACYWKCDSCNDGDWGFCNTCVNQGHHCTHPLLPLISKSSTSQNEINHLAPPQQLTQQQQPTPPLTPKSATIVRGPDHITLANQTFQPLSFRTMCDICTYPIPPSLSRFHCPKCNDGDYDICTNCYLSLVSSGRISSDNGHQGWRRCLQGHRMCVIGFEDRDGGQQRIVVSDFVGGWALKEEDHTTNQPPSALSIPVSDSASTTTPPNWSWKDPDGTVRKATVRSANTDASKRSFAGRFPPNGGVGLIVVANWAYFSDQPDELSFPKSAEIREAEDINGDWFWGVYAGRKGLFPGNFGVVLGQAR